MKKGKHEGKVIAFDFDGTITSNNCHSHNYLSNKKIVPFTVKNGLIVNGKSEMIKLCKSYNHELVGKTFLSRLEEKEEYLRTPKKFLETVRHFMKEGAKIAIVSYNQYPAVFKVALIKIGFSEEEILKFDIIAGFPTGDSENVGKNQHLKKLSELTSVTENKAIILVDDSETNFRMAKKVGYGALHVKNDNYLDDLIKLLNPENTSCITEEENILSGDLEDDLDLESNSTNNKENKLNNSTSLLFVFNEEEKKSSKIKHISNSNKQMSTINFNLSGTLNLLGESEKNNSSDDSDTN